MTKNEEVFFPLETVKELAELRRLRDKGVGVVANYKAALEATDAYRDLTIVENDLQIVVKHLAQVEVAFKAGCEDIFEETDEKKFPGGQIKMRSTLEYDEGKAVDWAIMHEHGELLSIIKKEFKSICKTLTPPFVTKGEVGKMYIDSDLSQYLEGSDKEE